MTTTKTYRVSDGYGVKTFTDRDEAIAYAMDVFKGFRADGMTRVEAAKSIEVKTTVIEVEDMAEFMGGKTFMNELERSDAEDAAEAETPKVEGLSKAMQEAYDGLVCKVNKAREAGSFGVWFFGSEERYEEARAKDSRFNVTTYDLQNEYNLALDGIVECECKTNTAIALANRGLIEFAGKNRVKVLGI